MFVCFLTEYAHGDGDSTFITQSDQFLHDNMEKMHICDDSDWKKIKNLWENRQWRPWNMLKTVNLERKLDLQRKSERAHEPHRERPRETRQTEWWKRADGRVILLCSHYFFLPDIIVWKMDLTADIIAFICNFLLHNSLASAPSKGDKYSPDEGREEAYSNVVAWTTRVLFQPP